SARRLSSCACALSSANVASCTARSKVAGSRRANGSPAATRVPGSTIHASVPERPVPTVTPSEVTAWSVPGPDTVTRWSVGRSVSRRGSSATGTAAVPPLPRPEVEEGPGARHNDHRARRQPARPASPPSLFLAHLLRLLSERYTHRRPQLRRAAAARNRTFACRPPPVQQPPRRAAPADRPGPVLPSGRGGHARPGRR